MAANERMDAPLPGWLCGRLAALYRTLERYDDEVMLLERYRDSQSSEDARVRYDARLSKARTIAERKRRRESGAVTSVRRVLARGRAANTQSPLEQAHRQSFTSSTMKGLFRAVEREQHFPGILDEALSTLCEEAREQEYTVEDIIGAVKSAYGTRSAGDRNYDASLVRVLSMYFERE